MGYSDYKHIQFSRSGRTMTMTLNRPDMLNAVNDGLHTELASVFRDLNVDPSIDIVIMTGAGKAFSAGGDVDFLRAMHADRATFDRARAEAKRIVFDLLDMEKILICKLNGHAMGLGATIALLSDVIIASDEAMIADPHVKIGLVAGDGGAIIWPQLIGYARAKELLLTGDPIDARRAESIGLISRAVPKADLDSTVDAFAAKLEAGAMLAIKYTKIAVNLPLRQLAHSLMDASMSYEALTGQSNDHLEGINAFSERRAPQFTGR